jgi:2-amino-4-hydroxy-6-hydroxymethyldihydropteridine diphosphokinase
MSKVYLSLGSNIGNRELNLCKAREYIRNEIGDIVAESSIYENDAVGFEGNVFYNQVIQVETELSPQSLLIKTQEIEIVVGRSQKTILKAEKLIYANRTIDIDILLYDDLQINTETLTLPHPKMYEREFVMKPLREIMSGLMV